MTTTSKQQSTLANPKQITPSSQPHKKHINFLLKKIWPFNKTFSHPVDQKTYFYKVKALFFLVLGSVFIVAAIIMGIYGFSAINFTGDLPSRFADQPGIVTNPITDANGNVTGTGINILTPLTNDSTARIVLSIFSMVILTAGVIFLGICFFYFLAFVKTPKKKLDKYDKKEQIENAEQSNKQNLK